MNCKTTQAWLVDYGDGTLSAERVAAVREHLAVCTECAGIAQDSASVRRLLGLLAPVQTSPQFDVALSARLAGLKQPPQRRSWTAWLPALPIKPLLRPALALGAATCAIVGAVLLHPASPPVVPPSASVADDSAFISQCVALHARDVAAQPLTAPVSPGVAAAHNDWTADTPTQDNL